MGWVVSPISSVGKTKGIVDDVVSGYSDYSKRVTVRGDKISIEMSLENVSEGKEPVMEPGFVKTPADEKRWAKAKAAAKASNPDDFYALANHIYHNMKDEASIKEAVLEAIADGADIDHILSGLGNPGRFEEEYQKAREAIFRAD
jgi:hypothetical protein